jgi:hypothetical protein
MGLEKECQLLQDVKSWLLVEHRVGRNFLFQTNIRASKY